jgi:hypothetical protein
MGKYYRYNLKQYEIDSFVGFATTWYSKLTPEKVTVPATPFENLVDLIVQQLKQLPNMKRLINENPLPALVIASLSFLIFLVFIFKNSKSKRDEEKPSKPATKTAKKEK